MKVRGGVYLNVIVQTRPSIFIANPARLRTVRNEKKDLEEDCGRREREKNNRQCMTPTVLIVLGRRGKKILG